jgi:CHAT domain-containing protein
MVVLSACDTGRGQVQVGEGVLGLRRAFQQAGAQTVLASLWKVPDTETEQLMTAFLRRWLGGADKSEALRQA